MTRLGTADGDQRLNKVTKRYQWKGIRTDIKEWVNTCEYCQRRAKLRYEEALHPTWSVLVWIKIGVDVVMPRPKEGSYLILARDDLSGWAERRAIEAADTYSVSKFLYEEVIVHMVVLRELFKMDEGKL